MTTALGLLVVEFVSAGPADVPWLTVAFGLVVGVVGVRRRRNLRRAVELNDEPAPPDGS